MSKGARFTGGKIEGPLHLSRVPKARPGTRTELTAGVQSIVYAPSHHSHLLSKI